MSVQILVSVMVGVVTLAESTQCTVCYNADEGHVLRLSVENYFHCVDGCGETVP